jgi:iron complex transport system substrate-binding protein
MMMMVVMAWIAASPEVPSARRIVSLAPTITETLFELGVGDDVVGVTKFCDRPVSAQALPKVGGYTDVSLEAILALQPTLVIGLRGPTSLYQRLKEQQLSVVVVATDSLDDVVAATIAIGDAVGQRAMAEQQVAALPPRAVPGAVHDVLIVVGTAPIVVAGPATFSAEVLQRAWPHARVVPSSPVAWPELSLESIAAFGPRLIVVVADGPMHEGRVRAALAQLPVPPRVVVLPRAALVRPSVAAIIQDVGLLRNTPVPP